MLPGKRGRGNPIFPTPAWLGFAINTGGHVLGPAVIIPWAEMPAM
jgi:hypothetical protein